jgi:hypothetical protein
MDKEIQNKNMTIDYLTQQLNIKTKPIEENLLLFD